MSQQAAEWAVMQKLPVTSKMVLLILAIRDDGDTYEEFDIDTLHLASGFKPWMVRSALHYLETHGFLLLRWADINHGGYSLNNAAHLVREVARST